MGRWVSFPEFLDSVERTPKAINILAFVPLNPLMVWAMGLGQGQSPARSPPHQNMKRCARLLDEAVAAGAMGISAQRTGERSSQRDFDGTPMATDPDAR